MRILIPNIITEKEAEKILAISPNQSRTIWDQPLINKILSTLTKQLPPNTEPVLTRRSYWRVERNWNNGHKWHYDGCKKEGNKFVKNHMAWCKYSASILLTDPSEYTGGTFKFDNPPAEHKEDHYLSAILYSSGADNDPQIHMVEPYTGNRAVLLMFLQTK